MGGGTVIRKGQRMGADQYAGGQIAEHRRQVEHPEGDHAEHGAAQQEQG